MNGFINNDCYNLFMIDCYMAIQRSFRVMVLDFDQFIVINIISG